MKKSSLNFLSKKTPNLFDTGVQIKHYENVDLVLDSAVIPESGTAKVRSRPTVKHFSTSGDAALGLAVPTPTVPVLPPLNGPQNVNSGSTDRLSNGGMMSVDDPEEGEILIPPPPSVAPPPPPPKFIPPSPQYIPPPVEFFGDLDPPVDLAALQPPSIPPPQPPSLTGSTTSEVHLSSLKPPPMAPPKPPSDIPSLTASVPISSPINSAQDIPESPKFTPPLPPAEKSPQSPVSKTQKAPPPKPVRLSSIYNLELPPSSTPSATPASSFKPQTTAKIYTVPKTTVLSTKADRETRTQHILLLEDTSGNPVGVHINGKATPSVKEVSSVQDVVPPVKPVRRNSSGMQLEKDIQDMKEEMLPIEPTKPDKTINGEPANVAMLQEVPDNIPVKGSPQPERTLPALSALELSQEKDQQKTKSKTHSYSPLLSKKLQTLRGHEGSTGKETAASPLALLRAAKEREKQRSGLSRQSSNKSSSSAESLNVTAHPSEFRPNSFIMTPIPTASEHLSTEPKLAIATESQPKPQSPKISRPEQTHFTPSSSPGKHQTDPTSVSPPRQEEHGEDAIPFIPPPPEFANSDPEDEAPPSTPPPDPPAKGAAHSVQSVPIINGPATPTKPTFSNSLTPSTAVVSTEPKLKKVVQIQPQAPAGQPPVQISALSLTQPKIQPQPPPPTQPPFQPPVPPPTQPPALPPVKPSTQPPAQLLARPPTQPPPPPPPTQPPIPPPTQPLAWPPTQTPPPPPPPPTQPPIPTQPPSQPLARPPTQPPAPPPSQPKIHPPVPPQTLPKTYTLPPAQSKIQTPAPTPPPSVSASQATLLSILQKKMLEMDPKFAPAREPDSSGDDWNSPLSDDDGATSPIRTTAKPKSTTLPVQSRGIDMKELENKVSKKAQDIAAKTPSNGPHSKQQYGMTFTVRPGTKQPITPVLKTD